MLASTAAALSRFSSRWVPDAWVIAVLLTLLTAALAVGVTGTGPAEVVRLWGDGFWDFLSFAMQMCLVIMTGYMLSTARPVRRLLERVAALPSCPRGAVALMALVSLVLGWIHWGLSVAASAVLVRHVARRQPGVDYRLLVCCAYLGVATIWHAGLSGSAPLLLATSNHSLVETVGVVPVADTIFAPFNLALSAVVLVMMPVLVHCLHPAPGDTVTVDVERLDTEFAGAAGEAPTTPAARLESSPLVNVTVAAAGFWWLAQAFWRGGSAAIDLNTVNFTFLMLAVLCHGTPASFLRSAAEGGRFVWGIVIQFPFYAGIAGILAGSGLSSAIADWFQGMSSVSTYPLVVLLYSGALNYIVPSGGSQWIVSGEYIMEAARNLGVGYDEAAIAFAWGDMSTNLIQPFWAIPLLTIAGLRFRDIMGFGVILFLLYEALLCAAFLLYGLL